MECLSQRTCLPVLLLALTLYLAKGQMENCEAYPDYEDYVMMDEEVQLQINCYADHSVVRWSVQAPIITSTGVILIKYQCSLETSLEPNMTLKQISLGGNYLDFQNGEAPHLIPSDMQQEGLVCRYFGCFKDPISQFVYPFDELSCTFGRKVVTSSTAVLTPLSSTVLTPLSTAVLTPSSTAVLTPSSTTVLTPPSTAVLTVTPSSLTVITPSSSTTVFTQSSPTVLTPSPTTPSPTTVLTPLSTTVLTPSSPLVTKRASSSGIAEFEVDATAVSRSTSPPLSSTSQEAALLTTPVPTGSSSFSQPKKTVTPGPDSPNQSNDNDVLIASVLCVTLVLMIVGGGLFAIVLGKHYWRLGREYKYPLKIVPGYNDDPTIDPDFSPVLNDDAQLPNSPSALSITTILDKFDLSHKFDLSQHENNPKALSMTSLQLQYLCDGVTDFFDLESDPRVPVYGSSQVISRDGTGSSDDYVHYYFSISQPEMQQVQELNTEWHSIVQENSMQDKLNMERHFSIADTHRVNVHEGAASSQSAEKDSFICRDTTICEPDGIEPSSFQVVCSQ